MWGWERSIPDRSVGKPYRDAIAARFAKYPLNLGADSADGGWEGTNLPNLPPQAVALLHPNFYLNRAYSNRMKGWQVSLLLIEAEESRDMMGHYPPNCYPGNGWQKVSETKASNVQDGAAEWIVGKLRIKGTEYEFTRIEGGQEQHLWVRDFFILPNNTFYADLATFGRAAADFSVRPYGATQVQVIYNQYYSPEDRERIFESLILAHMDLIDAMRSKD